jgi:hypothetical protein
MNTSWRTTRIAVFLTVALLASAATAWAGGHYPASHHGYHGHSSYSVGFNWAYPPPYWGPGYGYYPGYAPAYGPSWGPSYLSLGYGYGSHGSSYGLSFSIPLYFGPRYAPQPAPPPVPVAAAPIAYRQADPGCLQVREYQTEITVGGKPVPAYGSACLQADGSWKPISGPFAAE